MSQLSPDDLALAIEINQKKTEGISSAKEEVELAEKIKIAGQISDEMDGQPIDVEMVLIEIAALIVTIIVSIHSPRTWDQAMLVTGLILQRSRENQHNSVVHAISKTH